MDSPQFVPRQAMFEEASLQYPLGRRLMDTLRKMGTPISIIGSHNRVPAERGLTAGAAYMRAKRTLIVGVRKSEQFQTCKPSAHYQLPLCTSCPGTCQYCYLMTTLGKRPYIRVYVNLEEIMDRARRHMVERLPEVTVFEGAATSDPVPVERYTGALKYAIEFFAGQSHGRFRFVTKFADIEPILDARHEGHTEVRFSVNSPGAVSKYERGASALPDRIRAAQAVSARGYPTGFMIAPIILDEGWKAGYLELFSQLKRAVEDEPSLARATLELVTHRYTKSAKARIEEIFPESCLNMGEESRKFKFGQFGYGKYVYDPETMKEVEAYFRSLQQQYLPETRWLYMV